jgi:hypothetical protein
MKKMLLFTVIIGAALSSANAQNESNHAFPAQDTTVVADDPNSNVLSDFLTYVAHRNHRTKNEKTNGNRRWYAEPYFGFGFIAGDIRHNAARLLPGESYSIDFGIKSRYQVTRFYSLTFNTGWQHNRYKITDGIVNRILGDAPLPLDGSEAYVVTSERYRTWAFHVSIGNRLNFDGNRKWGRAGKYIELSAYGGYLYSRQYLSSFHGSNGIKAELSYKDPDLFLPFEAGVQANLGIGWLSVWGRYRLTDCFYSSQTNASLPPLTVGMAIHF